MYSGVQKSKTINMLSLQQKRDIYNTKNFIFQCNFVEKTLVYISQPSSLYLVFFPILILK